MKSHFTIENFFSENELAVFERAISANGPGNNSTPNHGPFANQLIANYIHFENDADSLAILSKRLGEVFDKNFNQECSISQLTRVKLFLPWDVHADLHPGGVKPGFVPFYNLLIPLEDANSRTIIFDQWSKDSNSFYEYKQTHDKVSDPIDIQFWEENLSMCWPEDRLYLTLRDAMPYQKRGQLHAIARYQFHSSDHFHTRGIKEKNFIQIQVDVLDENKS